MDGFLLWQKTGILFHYADCPTKYLKFVMKYQGENSMNEPIKYFDEIREFTPKELEALKKYQPAKKQHFVSTKLSSESLLKDIEAVNLEEQIKKCQTPNNY